MKNKLDELNKRLHVKGSTEGKGLMEKAIRKVLFCSYEKTYLFNNVSTIFFKIQILDCKNDFNIHLAQGIGLFYVHRCQLCNTQIPFHLFSW